MKFQPSPYERAARRQLGLCLAVGLLAVTVLPSAVRAADGQLSIVSFNVESDRDTDPGKVADDIALVGKGADLFGLAEVASERDLEVFRLGAERSGAPFEALFARAGDQDRLAILYNVKTLLFRGVRELDRFPGSRKAMIGRFVHRQSQIEFLFMVNHFNRRDTERRRRQAVLIRDWILDQPLPVVVTGDHNFDFNPKTMQGNLSFDLFTQDPGLQWVRPLCLEERSCPPNGTQCDARFNSIMDFVLIADQGRGWRAVSDVMLKGQDYCQRERRGWSDHRPVGAVIVIR